MKCGKHSIAKKSNTKYLLILIISLICLIVPSIIYINSFINKAKIKQIEDTILKTADIEESVLPNEQSIEDAAALSTSDYLTYKDIPFIDVNFDNLLNINKNTVAWIKVNGTGVNYPVLQSSNNQYYLKHAFDGSKNAHGWIYLDYRNNLSNLDQNTVIYGHSGTSNITFQLLLKTLEPSWYNDKDNHIIKLSTPTNNMLLKVFSVYTIPETDDYLDTNYKNINDYLNFINMIKNRSIYNFNVDINTNDYILTLSTCYKKGYRLVVHAKFVVNQSK